MNAFEIIMTVLAVLIAPPFLIAVYIFFASILMMWWEGIKYVVKFFIELLKVLLTEDKIK